jgi:polyhydroxyalkanoate synthesis regulator phasin
LIEQEHFMADPENQTLRILREIRSAMKGLDGKVSSGFEAVDGRFGRLESRLDNIWQALNGESILGRYAVAEVDERIEAIEKRLTALEKAD